MVMNKREALMGEKKKNGQSYNTLDIYDSSFKKKNVWSDKRILHHKNASPHTTFPTRKINKLPLSEHLPETFDMVPRTFCQ